MNAELEAVSGAVTLYLDLVREGGNVIFMSYHSLEDKIVKKELTARTRSTTPADLPVELPGHEAQYRLLTRGASDDEIEGNPRSASVRVRCAERIAPRKLPRKDR